MIIAAPEPDGRVRCAVCGRAFAADRIVKHQFICATTAAGPPKKPKEVGDRVAEVVQLAVMAKTGKAFGQARKERPKPPSKWRAASEELQQALRAAREGQRLDALKAQGLVYFNGKPKPGVTEAQMRAASAPPRRQPLAAVDGWAAAAAGPPTPPSAAHAAAVAEHQRRQQERLAALDEIKFMVSEEEYAAKRAQIMGTPPPQPPAAPARSPPQWQPAPAMSQRPPPRPASPTRA